MHRGTGFVCLLFAANVATAQEENDSHRNIRVQVEVLNLYHGLSEGAWGSSVVPVGIHFGNDTTTEKDSSGKVVYLRTITGQSRWLPDNAIEMTLEINENGVNRTETIRLENLEPRRKGRRTNYTPPPRHLALKGEG
jgi:hypothetical protein